MIISGNGRILVLYNFGIGPTSYHTIKYNEKKIQNLQNAIHSPSRNSACEKKKLSKRMAPKFENWIFHLN